MAMVFSHFVILLLTGLLVLCGFVAVSDYKYRRIPNSYLKVATYYALFIFAAMFIYLPAGQVLRGFLMSLLGLVIGGYVCFF